MKNTNANIIALFLCSCGSVAIFLALSFLARKPEWLNRGGSVVAATAAAFAFVQIRLDIATEERRQRLTGRTLKIPREESVSPIGDVARRLKEKKSEKLSVALTGDRIRFAAAVALCACVGELLHGMGDLLLIYFFPSHF